MKKDEANAAKKKPKTSAAQIRVQKGTHFLSVALLRPYRPRRIDLSELELPSTMKTDFPDAADLLNFTLTISPDEGRPLASACRGAEDFVQACTRAAPLSSPSTSTPTTRTTRQRSNAPRRSARPCLVSLGLDVSTRADLPPQRRPRRQRLPEHPPRGLEARPEPQFRHGRPAVPLPGTQCG
jgi:hypothetical protein